MALQQGGKLRNVGIHGQDGTYGYAFWCPGCNSTHVVWVKQSPSKNHHVWKWNNNTESPTFEPSILVRYSHWVPPVTAENMEEFKRNPWPQTKKEEVCHSFVRDGQIQFLGDCTHKLKSQTVPIPQWPSEEAW